ncbi:hypothetical protein [Pseudomarimonas salicorniae]|uniref:DUF4304 domain-containing protein n=1 Tax=Pseudomarimonas salicorniae TaxID=2933270 RepID=A0ABT0GM56_9GAMM|nr:hypothetical protein [Lysobacter sp. CAU 1642]MCK7595631.1 hypothetical protein [Lysobacter sp. CAU 1642]
MDKVAPTLVKRILSSRIGPVLANYGFSRTKTTILGWDKASDLGFLSVFLPFEKYGWSAQFGSSFLLQFQEGLDSHPFTLNRRKMCWFTELLDKEGLSEALDINNAIVAQLEDPVFERDHKQQGDIDWLRWGKRVRVRPYVSGEYIELCYTRVGDVEKWAAFIASRLPEMLQAFQYVRVTT